MKKNLLRVATAGMWVALTSHAIAQPSGPARIVTKAESYNPKVADQRLFPRLPDFMPTNPEARRIHTRALAYDAAIYGKILVLHYLQMHSQAVDQKNPGYTGFNVFAHDRTLAEPGYKPFKTPNADTLYSNAWLDLTRSPVLLDVPDTAGRYYTLNFLDVYGNASNISARTHGTKGGRYLIASANWRGEVPAGVTLFRVATPYTWILMRILATDAHDAKVANALQDKVRITSLAQRDRTELLSAYYPAANITGPVDYFSIIDFMLRANGNPVQEDALVYRFRGLGIGNGDVGRQAAEQSTAAGMAEGYADAMKVIERSLSHNGRAAGSWNEPVDIGRYGFNYLYRAAINTLGTGANVTDENFPFTTFKDGDGKALDGSKGSYRLVLSPPPPAKFFWSVTAYDARTRELIVNPDERYIINDRTKGLQKGAGGSVTVYLQREKPAGGAAANWIPVPDGPFYLAIRAQGPTADLLEGRWKPQPVVLTDLAKN